MSSTNTQRLFQWGRHCAGDDVPTFLDADPGMDKIYNRVGFQTISETYCLKGTVYVHSQYELPA